MKKPTSLTPQELTQMLVANKDKEIRNFNVKVMNLDIAVFEERARNQSLQAQLARHRLIIMQKEHAEIEVGHKNWIADLRQKYGIKESDSFGYDPETGEIIIGKEGAKQ